MSNLIEFHELNMSYCSMHQKYRKGKREKDEKTQIYQYKVYVLISLKAPQDNAHDYWSCARLQKLGI